MSQPTWKFVANLGDASPIEYGGYFIYVDETGVYAPEGEWLESPDDDNGTWVVRRFSLERCTFIDGVLSDNRFHPEHAAWFARDIAGVASFIGVETSELIEWLCSEDVLERADAWRAIGDYHGFANLDDYPLTLNKSEVEARYADLSL